ncbi:restriction endonuclease subunit S [Halomonas marinisediminis]|uniref:Restriction endonuclease subunit S n=2 Tax=Halomonas marinisediminis TaxID=2546095 RepID=A0ABY2D9U6_9GAMM|nr:restriction endonuclease subunit S [Halomonas marinisediminis]
MPSNVDKRSVEGEQPVLLCNYTDVYYHDDIVQGMSFMQATASGSQVEKFSLLAGDVIFTKDSESSDDIAIAAHVPEALPGVVCGYHLSIARPHPSIIGRFLKHYFDSRSAKSYFDVSANGLTRVGLSQYASDNLPTPLPPIEEQATIAAFLDHETARIDNLVEQQQRLIELLKEKRQAVISHAVTKGLDPDMPMKDSGVEWLGEVPAHWELSKLGYLSAVVRGGSPRPAGDPKLFNGDYSPWVTVAEITKDEHMYLDSTETCLTKLGSAQCRVFKKGTLLLSNSGATLGVPKILKINANANDGVVGFESLSKKLIIEFAYYFLKSITESLRDRIRQGSGQPNLNTDIVGGVFIPLPELEEQRAIANHIKEHMDEYEAAEKAAETLIALLTERRSALISAAVTGKIDVRGWQPPAGSSATSEHTQTELV